MTTPTHIPGSELYPTWSASDFMHYSAFDLNYFVFTNGLDVALPVNGDQTRLTP